MTGFGRREKGEFGRDRLAERYSSRSSQQRDARRIRAGPVAAVDRAAVLGGQIHRVDDVFDTEGDAVEGRAARVTIALAGPGKRALRIEMRPGPDLRVSRLHALEQRSDPDFGGHPFLCDFARSVPGGDPGEVLRHRRTLSVDAQIAGT